MGRGPKGGRRGSGVSNKGKEKLEAAGWWIRKAQKLRKGGRSYLLDTSERASESNKGEGQE